MGFAITAFDKRPDLGKDVTVQTMPHELYLYHPPEAILGVDQSKIGAARRQIIG